MTAEGKTIIEVNGIKLEVDLRSARRIDTLAIGSRVKCLRKGYGGDMTTFPGVVVGFEPFPTLPTIVVAYLDTGYGSKGMVFKSFNAETKDFEVVADLDNNALEVDRANVLANFDREIDKKQREIDEMKAHRDFFLAKFGSYFKAPEPVVEFDK